MAGPFFVDYFSTSTFRISPATRLRISMVESSTLQATKSVQLQLACSRSYISGYYCGSRNGACVVVLGILI
ncbi:MAG TPA: hypothetical protein VLQ91_19120 [Draconibacterium sp.]|nr:hypothetical protein [Draconibacterium sp.]